MLIRWKSKDKSSSSSSSSSSKKKRKGREGGKQLHAIFNVTDLWVVVHFCTIRIYFILSFFSLLCFRIYFEPNKAAKSYLCGGGRDFNQNQNRINSIITVKLLENHLRRLAAQV